MQTDSEDEYAFTAWMSLKLDPIVRNDPKKIAAYIVAAIRKNKEGKDQKALRQFCQRKLNDFVEDKDKLSEFCEELITAYEDHRYREVREHPSYATLLDQEAGPLTPSNKEYPTVREDKRCDGNSQTRRKRSGSYSDDADESIEDRPPRGRGQPDRKAAVNSTISVVKDAMIKRVGDRTMASGKPICKDFTERGFCLRGQLCPYDHGNEPFVWQTTRPMDVIRYTGPPRPPHPHPGLPQPQRLPGFPPMMPLPIMRPLPPRFRPDGPPGLPPFSINMRPKPPPPANFRPRELMGIPTEDMLRGGDLGKREGDVRLVNNLPVKRLAVDNAATNNCSLEIHQIPFQLNNIAALNAHFYKYGNIVNVQVRYNGDPASALVTFQTPDAASRAYNSSEPVLNNRFISIAWHNPTKPPQIPDTTMKWTAKPVPSTVSVSKEKETAPTESTVSSSESRTGDAPEVTVTKGFTQGLRVRYPVGARRARAGRYVAGAPVRPAMTSHGAMSAQPTTNITAHQRSIYMSLQATKTENELDQIQTQIATLDESIQKVTSLIRQFQQTSEKTKGLETDATGANKEEAAQMLEKIEKQIQQLQKEKQRFEEERIAALKRQSEVEARLNSQKNQIEAEKFVNDLETGVDHEKVDADKDSGHLSDRALAGRSRPMGRRVSRGRVAPLRGTRSGIKRTVSGATRFRRPARGAPFNRTVDRRPRRLKLTGFDEADRQIILDQIEMANSTIEKATDLEAASILVTFNTRYDAEAFLRELIGALEGRKLAATWLIDSRHVPSTENDIPDYHSLDNNGDATDSESDEKAQAVQVEPDQQEEVETLSNSEPDLELETDIMAS